VVTYQWRVLGTLIGIRHTETVSELQQQHFPLSHNNGTVSTLGRVHTMRDLGVLIDDKLHFSDHVYDKVHKSYYMPGLIKRNFEHLDSQTFVQLYIKSCPIKLRIRNYCMESPQRILD